MNFTPQQFQIINLLSDGEFHCPTNELFMKDDRKRISELRKKGFVFESPICTLHQHNSQVVMRRIKTFPIEKQEVLPQEIITTKGTQPALL